MPGESRAVFLSYASEDAEAASRIADALKSAGIEVWFDKSELRGGDAWDRRIRDQIHACRLFIAVISGHSEARDEGYFRREWRLAIERAGDMAEHKAFIVPVVIDDTSERAPTVPDRFRQVQWTRLPAGATPPAFVARMQALLAGMDPLVPQGLAMPAPRVPVTTTRRWSRWGYFGALTLSALYVAGYLVYARTHRSAQTATSAATPANSIAVLPFLDLSEKQDQQFLADGVAEEILDELTRIPELKVIGRTSSFQFRGKSGDMKAIGASLGAEYVVEGSVRRSPERLRVTAQLTDARDGARRWSQSYDVPASDLITLQDTIAADIARTLKITVADLDPVQRKMLPEAHELFIRALQSVDRNSEEGVNEAIAQLKEAQRIDPASSRIASELGYAYGQLGQEGWATPAEAFAAARRSAETALKLDATDSLAHEVLAVVAAGYEWNWPKAELEIRKALDLGSRTSSALIGAGQIQSTQGHWEAARELLEEALVKDPLSADAEMVLGAYVYSMTGNYPKAEQHIRRALQIRPHWGTGHYYLATALLMQGRFEAALQESQLEEPVDGKYQGAAEALYALHRVRESDAELKRAIDQNGSDWPISIAKVYAYRGEKDEALRWLEKAYAYRDEDLWLIKGDPHFRSMEQDPRYKAFLRKMNLPE